MISIGTNAGALMAKAATASVQIDAETAMQRLSSGKRINAAKDDAAGVAIASRMTSHVKGLHQSIRNSMDAQALIGTAEGGLQETEVLLQRIRELAVQASNDTNSDADRTNLNNEAQQLLEGIDAIASGTTWAGQNLLDGTYSNKSFQVGGGSMEADQVTTSLQSSTAIELGLTSTVTSTIETYYQTPVKQANVEIAPEASVFSDIVSRPSGKNALTWVVNSESGNGYDIYYRELDEFGKLYGDSKIIHSSTSGAVNSISATALSNGKFAFAWADTTLDVYRTMTIDAEGAKSSPISLDLTNGPSSGADITQLSILGLADGKYLVSFRDGPDDTVNSLGINYSNHANTGQYAQIYYNSGQQFKNTFGINNFLPGHADQGRYSALDNGGFVATWRSAHLPNDSSRTSTSARIFDPSGNPVSEQFQVNDFIESYQSKPKVTTLTDGSFVFLWENNHSGVDGNGRAVVAEHYNVDGTIRKSDFIANTSTLYNQWNPKITALHDGGYFTAYSNTPISGSSTLLGQRFDKNSEKIGSEITIHEPPHYHTDYYNLNDNGFIAIYKQSDGALISNSYFTKIETTASTVAGIDLTSGELSREALTRLDTALQTINSQRAELGSLSNRLDHIIANNTNASTNTKASLGRIQDADFAAETTKLAKSKILEQSSTAMLAQANASVYEVLTLIPD